MAKISIFENEIDIPFLPSTDMATESERVFVNEVSFSQLRSPSKYSVE